jgi:hypothetical protein
MMEETGVPKKTTDLLQGLIRFDLIDLLCITPLSAIFELYHGNQF